MNNSFQFQPHLSSLGKMDANILALLAYLLGWVLSFIPVIQGFAWLVPLVIFLLEKDSPLVRFHAIQSFLLNISAFVLVVLISLVFGGGAFLSLVSLGVRGSSSMSTAFLGTSFMALLFIPMIFIGSLILAVIAMIKAYHYQAYRLPVIGNWAARIAGLDQ